MTRLGLGLGLGLVWTACLALAGCQAATGLTDLAVMEEWLTDGGLADAGLPAADGGRAGAPASGGRGGSTGAGTGGASGDGSGGAGGADTGGSGGVSPDEPEDPGMMMMTGAGSGGAMTVMVATAGSGGGGSGGASMTPPPAEQCEHPDAPCSITQQCGCDEGLACGVKKTGDEFAIDCTPPGRIALGGTCEGLASCQPGALCIGQDHAICRKACELDLECGAGALCLSVNNVKGAGFCAQTCDSNDDCPTACCAPSSEGVKFCVPNAACTEPLPNGEVCTANSQCMSNNCLKDSDTQAHCYGTLDGDSACKSNFDCQRGLCLRTTVAGSAAVCVDNVEQCVAKDVDLCFIKLAYASCQLLNKCDANAGSFDACILQACTAAPMRYTLQECQQAEPGFGKDLECPSSP